ncbi:hypothetical protein LWI29_023068 [Acer saccharum]|uniref:Leucine-rich repeat-containing N-terminal plant-type domain-containing protein n=1 Tax=Acer saccharum TaxID=4024 RepID=A0AA39SXA4_ACESA|nr:hypothetical protein LWI29_023068 [Acer saccharum]
MAASELSATELERKALLNTGWFNNSFANNLPSNPCNWTGIFCNTAGSITEIDLSNHFSSYDIKGELGQLNFSCFPNLQVLNGSYQLSGNIPPQIGLLSKLKYLNLSSEWGDGEQPVDAKPINTLASSSARGDKSVHSPVEASMGQN